MRTASPRKRERGQALVELVVALPLFGVLLMGAQRLFHEVDRKLQLQKAGHYATWELTAFSLSDYQRGEHALRLRTAIDRVSAQMATAFPGIAWEVQESSGVSLPGGLGDRLTLNGGGHLRLEARSGRYLHRESLSVDGWALPDGSDAVIRDGRAGNRRAGTEPHLLHTQVSRMTFGGASKALGGVGGVERLIAGLGIPRPAWGGTFVVAHNYGPASGEPPCEGIPGYPQGARGGLSRFGPEVLDFDRPQCFDTAPFRDTQSYDRSLYLRMFRQRGLYFMGCAQPQVDESDAGDFACGGSR